MNVMKGTYRTTEKDSVEIHYTENKVWDEVTGKESVEKINKYDYIFVDNNENILGKIYKIGATILNNEGKYVGRLNAKGIVVDEYGKDNGYIKNNGSFVDLDKKISGYALPEVAKNRRN